MRKPPTRQTSAWAPLGVALAASLACGTSSERDALIRGQDAGSTIDAGPDVAPRPDASPEDLALGGPCVDDGQCNDSLACTYDRCDATLKRCRFTPDDAACDDGIYCNGRETCALQRGCTRGGVVACDDENACTLDRCVEASKSCARTSRDADGDGDTDARCVGGRDCDDADPTATSTASEICGNTKDDDCDGAVDEAGCVTPPGDTCAAPVVLGGAGAFRLRTAGAAKDVPTTCGIANSAAARDVVAAITIPPGGGGPQDLDVWASVPAGEVSVAVLSTCDPPREATCGAAVDATRMRVRARALTPGSTYFIVVTTQGEADIDLTVVLANATPRPTNETCAAPASIALETPLAVSIIDPTKDLASACAAATGELTYAFTLAAAADVRVFPTVLAGVGSPVIGLRTAACAAPADELRCRVGTTVPLFARALPAGDYVLTVAATAPLDASILVKTYPATIAPADQSCTAPPSARVNGTMPVDLTSREDALKDGCLAGWPNAAFDLPLATASDLLVVGRFPQVGNGAVSLVGPTCTAADRQACASSFTPARFGKRNVAPGSYRVVITDTVGQTATLTTLVRPTVPPILVTAADACADAIDIPSTGGYLTGDTTASVADFLNGCDSAGQSAGGAPDQILRLVLPQRKRVVFSMEGSSFMTILDVRQGATCPGQALAGACFVGFTPARSFLDQTLDAGTYWVIIDGYNGEKGTWNLDVHVVDP